MKNCTYEAICKFIKVCQPEICKFNTDTIIKKPQIIPHRHKVSSIKGRYARKGRPHLVDELSLSDGDIARARKILKTYQGRGLFTEGQLIALKNYDQLPTCKLSEGQREQILSILKDVQK